jgi:hypothetical protein
VSLAVRFDSIGDALLFRNGLGVNDVYRVHEVLDDGTLRDVEP